MAREDVPAKQNHHHQYNTAGAATSADLQHRLALFQHLGRGCIQRTAMQNHRHHQYSTAGAATSADLQYRLALLQHLGRGCIQHVQQHVRLNDLIKRGLHPGFNGSLQYCGGVICREGWG